MLSYKGKEEDEQMQEHLRQMRRSFSEPFPISQELLCEIVNFDERDNIEQVKVLNARFGGVEGVAQLLRTNVKTGLRLHSNDSISSLTAAPFLFANQPLFPGDAASNSKLHVPQLGSSELSGHETNNNDISAGTKRNTPKEKGLLNTVESSKAHPVDRDQRILAFGPNVVPPLPTRSIFGIVWGTIVEDTIIKILIGSAITTLILGIILGEGWMDGLAILIAVCIVLFVTAGNDYYKERKFRKMLHLQSDKRTKVVRGGRRDVVSSWDLLVGDVVELSIGDEIPADGIYISGSRLAVDESHLTGESVQVRKSPRAPFLFAGGLVCDGQAMMLVTAVGVASACGQVQSLINASSVTDSPTVLQLHLGRLALQIGKLGFMAGIITFLGLSIRHIISAVAKYSAEPPYQTTDLLNFLHFFTVSVTVIVVAVPEGLPLAVTISLAFSMFKMIKDRCFIRHLEASETMGEATCICTDKTGTLTENRMTVVKLALAGEQFALSSVLVSAGLSPFKQNAIQGSKQPSPTVQPSPGCLITPDTPAWLTELIGEAVSVNSTCFLQLQDQNAKEKNVSTNAEIAGSPPTNVPMRPKFIGSATEGALLVLISQLGFDYEELRRRIVRPQRSEYLFTSERKRMSILCEPQVAIPCTEPFENLIHSEKLQSPQDFESTATEELKKSKENLQISRRGNQKLPLFRLYTKGASETIIELCNSVITAGKNGKQTQHQPMTDSMKRYYIDMNKTWASEGLRVLALAYRDFSRPLTRSEVDDPEHNLTLLALFGIKDPVRENVPDAVLRCQRAGIRVRIVTGDNVLTAIHVARECHILPPPRRSFGVGTTSNTNSEHDSSSKNESFVDDNVTGCVEGEVMEGPKFRSLTPEQKRAVIPRLRVLARSSPADKHALVVMLKEMGEVVAVTGDGTNDAAALKEADVGFAMAISGTQVAMNASDIILLDDNFVSIVQAIRWGRNVLVVVRRFLQFQLSVNIVAIIITITGSIFSTMAPLSSVQLLWVNLIMDTLGALGLASDVPDDRLLTHPPHSRNDSIVTKSMQYYILVQSLYQIVILLTVWFSNADWLSNPYLLGDNTQSLELKWRSTMVFTIFVLMQVVNEITCRQLDYELNIFRGTLKNRLFPLMLTIILVVQVVAVQLGGDFMGTLALTSENWLQCVGLALIGVPVVLASRGIVHLRKKRYRKLIKQGFHQKTTRFNQGQDHTAPVNYVNNELERSAKQGNQLRTPAIIATQKYPASP